MLGYTDSQHRKSHYGYHSYHTLSNYYVPGMILRLFLKLV